MPPTSCDYICISFSNVVVLVAKEENGAMKQVYVLIYPYLLGQFELLDG